MCDKQENAEIEAEGEETPLESDLIDEDMSTYKGKTSSNSMSCLLTLYI